MKQAMTDDCIQLTRPVVLLAASLILHLTISANLKSPWQGIPL